MGGGGGVGDARPTGLAVHVPEGLPAHGLELPELVEPPLPPPQWQRCKRGIMMIMSFQFIGRVW